MPGVTRQPLDETWPTSCETVVLETSEHTANPSIMDGTSAQLEPPDYALACRTIGNPPLATRLCQPSEQPLRHAVDW
jgi:hypothetical protein